MVANTKSLNIYFFTTIIPFTPICKWVLLVNSDSMILNSLVNFNYMILDPALTFLSSF